MNRPLVWVALGFSAGVLLAASGYAYGVAIPAGLCLAGAACMYVFSTVSPSRPLGVFVCFLGAGALLYTARNAGPPGDPLSRFLATHEPGLCRIEGTVRTVPHADAPKEYAHFFVDAHRIALSGRETAVEGGVLVRWSNPDALPYPGERVAITGRWDLALARVNPGIESWEDQLRRDGIHTAVTASRANAVEVLAHAPWSSVRYWTSRFRRLQAERLEAVMPESARAFAMTVWLGDRTAVTSETYSRYVAAGTSHILAISGIHIAIVFVTASAFFDALTSTRKRAATLALALVWLFALTSGARAPALRASMMFTVYVLADFAERERDAPTALSIAALLFLAWRPSMLFDAGFQLSFLSVASILLFLSPIADALPRVPHYLRRPLALPVAVQVLSLPAAAWHFHGISIAAPLANLLVVPLLAAALWLCFITSILSFLWGSLAELFGHALLPVTALIGGIIDVVRDVPGAHIEVSRPSGAALAAYWLACGMAAAVLAKPPHRRLLLAAAGCLLAASILWWRPVPPPEVVVLDVGRADAIYIHTPGGETVLVDGGDRSEFVDTGRRVLVPFMRARGVRKLDKVILTHAHRDHVGGLLTVLETFRVGELLVGAHLDTSTPETLEARLANLCQTRGIPVRHVRMGETIELAGAVLDVLHPDGYWAQQRDLNNRSVVCRLRWPGGSLLLTGDIEEPAELHVSQRDCRSIFLKVPHHGSHTSSSDALLDAVAPRYALVSTGPRQGEDGMHPSVSERYRLLGIKVLRTDRHGGLRIPLDADSLTLEAARLERGYPVVGGTIVPFIGR